MPEAMSDENNAPSITVYRGAPPRNSYGGSPFATKLEARLRFDGVRYSLGHGSPPSGPRRKVPYVEMRSAGTTETMGDSALIIRALVDNGILGNANASLSPAQRARDLAIRAMVEDRAYFYGVREKWCDNYTTQRSNALAAAPWLLQPIIGFFVYRSVTSALYGQGTGRFDDDEVRAFNEEVWESLDALLAESKPSAHSSKPFWILGGSDPTEADATVFGFIAAALTCEAAPATGKIVRGHPSIMEYARRIHEQYFPDYEVWS